MARLGHCLFLLPATFSIFSFMAAVTPEQATAKWDTPLPTDWSAGVMNHGSYYRWWTIRERPFLFAASVAILVIAIGLNGALTL